MNAETLIRRALDGTFTRLTDGGKVITVKVRRDFMPAYDGTPEVNELADRPRALAPWTDEENASMLEWRRKGQSFELIAAQLMRTTGALTKQMSKLRRLGRT